MENGKYLYGKGKSFLSLIKECIKHKDLNTGIQLHSEIAKTSVIKNDILVGNNLVHMYVRCGSLVRAQNVFLDLSVRDVVTWNTIITAFIKSRCSQEVLRCFEQMQVEGVFPDSVTFICILKACEFLQALEKGIIIHSWTQWNGLLQTDHVVGSTLVEMYVKCGHLDKAQKVFDGICVKDTVLWTILVAGYVDSGFSKQALKCVEKMELEGIPPDSFTLACSVRACATMKAKMKGQKLHSEIEKKGLIDNDVILGNSLVDVYSKCGLMADALCVFDSLESRDIVSWNSLIAGYSEQGYGNLALQCISEMQLQGFSPDSITYTTNLKACVSVGDFAMGIKMHADVERKGLSAFNLTLCNALVDMYCKFGLLPSAQKVFDSLHVRDVVSWTTLIAGYTRQGHAKKALKLHEEMQMSGIIPDPVTFVCSLQACNAYSMHKLHMDSIKNGCLGTVVGNALVHTHMRCGLPSVAKEVFTGLPNRDAITWNTLMTGYVKHGHAEEAITCFDKMQLEGIFPNNIAVISCLKACGSIKDRDKGRKMHSQIKRDSLLQRDHAVLNTLVDMYAKCGLLSEAHEVFDHLPVHNVVSWTILIAGYAENGYGEAALKCFEQMQDEGIAPDSVTHVSILKACVHLGAAKYGINVHAEIEKQGGFERNIFVGNSLVNVYAKAGMLTRAEQIFNKLPVQDSVSWNALLGGYAKIGRIEKTIEMFDKMLLEGKKPNSVTFVIVMNMCSRMGLVEKCKMYFDLMTKYYGMNPIFQHYACIVDLLGRDGQLDKAIGLSMGLPFHAIENTILTSYRKWGSLELGEKCFENGMILNEPHPYPNMS